MNTRMKQATAGGIAAFAVAGVVTLAAVFGASAQTATPDETPTPEVTVEVDPASFPVPTTPDRVIDQATSDSLEAQRAAEAEAARVAAEQAAAQAEIERAAAEQAAADQAARDQQRQTTQTNTQPSGGGQGNQAAPAPVDPPAPRPLRPPSAAPAARRRTRRTAPTTPAACGPSASRSPFRMPRTRNVMQRSSRSRYAHGHDYKLAAPIDG
jgi:hypothetical protein